MIFFPHAKINIGLQVLRKRTDGFHDLSLSFIPLWDFNDIIEIIPAAEDSFEVCRFDLQAAECNSVQVDEVRRCRLDAQSAERNSVQMDEVRRCGLDEQSAERNNSQVNEACSCGFDEQSVERNSVQMDEACSCGFDEQSVERNNSQVDEACSCEFDVLSSNDNLVVQARDLLRKYANVPPCAIYLHKHIPTGAGLGGGSSDAAYTLLGLNEVFSLGFSTEQLQDYARLLGSDCAFFLEDGGRLASGKGDIFSPLPMRSQRANCATAEHDAGTNTDSTAGVKWFKGKSAEHLADANADRTYACSGYADAADVYDVVVVKPPFSISTAEAYKSVTPDASRPSLAELLQLPLEQWCGKIENDFEKPLREKYPQIEEIKNELYKCGALYASLSGSGSAIYGIFKHICPHRFAAISTSPSPLSSSPSSPSPTSTTPSPSPSSSASSPPQASPIFTALSECKIFYSTLKI
ncbi:MAG: hypothetical protein LBF01_02015 [Bacteroidales bacterium]|jgi:4-diphosphocytidyl-2-C-methyl-D-erythritol kinase|nr:hypothetical protein [Bacteroidales bacterium]